VSDNVRFTVTATDQASDDFQRIGQNAARMGQAVTQAGRSASQGLRPIQQDARTAQTALTNLEREAARVPTAMSRLGQTVRTNATTFVAMGAAAGVLAGALSDAARAAAEEEAIFARLEAAVDATGESYADYAVEIDAAIAASERLSFADDEAATALSNLTTTTGDAARALDLLAISQDLARGKGIDLAAASNIVGRVAEGNIGILARYGIAVQDGATATEALALLQERYAGQAVAYADSTQGALDRVVNTVDNFVESVGASTGELQLLLTLLPGLSAGFTLVGGAAGLAIKGIQALRASSTLAAAAIGPVGLGLVAVAGGAAIAYKAWEAYQQRQDNATISTEELETATRSLLAVMVQIRDIGGPSGAITALNDASRVLEEIVATSQAIDTDNLETLKDDLFGINETMREIRENGMSSEGPGSFFDASDLPALEQRRLALQATVTALEGARVSEEELTEATADLQAILSDTTRSNYPQLINAVQTLTSAHDDGLITNDAYLAGISRLADEVDTYGISVADVVGPIDAATEATRRLVAERARLAGPMREGVLDPNDEGLGLPDATAEAARNAAAAERAAAGQIKLAAGMASARDAAVANAESLRAAQSAVVDYIASGENLLQLLLDSGHELSGEQGFLRQVIKLDDALTALDSTYQIIIGGTERLGATSGQLADWAQGLIDAGEAGPALDSLNQIIATNAEVQADVLAIQQAQAPYLAALQADTAAYVDELSRQDAQQQRNVLTMMDANSQQQLAALYAAATKAEMGELGASGEQYVNDMAAGLKVTNPLLYDMLLSTGAIKETADGIAFNFDEVDASALVSTLDDLNDTLGDLVRVIDELNGKEINPKVNDDFLAKLKEAGGFASPHNYARGNDPGTPLAPGGLNDGTGGPGGSVQTVTLELDATNYTAQVDAAREQIEALAGEGFTVVLAGDGENAVAVISDVQGNVTALVSDEYVFPIDADGDPAIGASNDVKGVVLELVNGRYVATINGDGSLAQSEIDAVNDALNAVNGTTGVIYIEGDASGARSAITSVSGYQGEAYVYIRGIPIGTSISTGQFAGAVMRDGGVVGYDAAALDGIVTRGGMRSILVGEAGREILNVPAGSSVVPAPMTSAKLGNGRGGGRELNFNFYGPVYGADDLQQMIGQAVRSAQYQGAL
jgi:ElaB/YqjD/DUF883 family membrane-anchored ribosome-binding protein